MTKQMPNLISAKMIRVDKENNTLLVWFGGKCIFIYSLQTKEEKQTVEIKHAPNKDYVTYSAVKKLMKAIIGGGK